MRPGISNRSVWRATAVAALLVVLLTAAVGAEVFYVAADGDDSGAGTIADPWASLAGARDGIRPVLDGAGDVTVYFRGGTYTFTETVVLGTDDDGTASQSITYAAYPGETPVFSSLVRLTGWSSYGGNIMQADLPAGVSHVRYLHDGSEEWMERSATAMFNPATVAFEGSPENEHFEPEYQVNKTFCVYPAGFSFPDWSQAAQYDLRIKNMPWTVNILRIASVDAGARRIDVAVPGHYSLNDGLDDLRTETWVMNSIHGITSPGEWASLDGKVYLYPKSGTADVYVPMTTELVRVDDGTADGNAAVAEPVRYIHFEGITFTGADFRPVEATDVTAQHDWQVVDVASGLLRFRNAANCSVRNSTFTKSGGDGIRLDRYAQNITIAGSDFSFLGRTAISLSGRGPGWGDVNTGNTISGNHIATPGRIKWDSPAILIDQSSANQVSGNYVEDTYMSAIVMTGGRSSIVGERIAHDANGGNIINRSMHFLEIAQSVLDFAKANSLEESAQFFYDYDNVIERNTMRDIHSAPFFTIGGLSNGVIYLTGTKYMATEYIRKNYFYDCQVNGTDPDGYDTWLLLGDGFQDYALAEQNMVHNFQAGDSDIEAAEIWNLNCNEPSGECWAKANVIQNSSFSLMDNIFARRSFYLGDVDFDLPDPTGDVAVLSKYEEMWTLLCPGVLPGPSPLPGAAEMQANLATLITGLGGTVSTCSLFSDGFESGDTSAWSSAVP